MAPNEGAVERQTAEIIRYLVEDGDVCSPCSCSEVEADGPADTDTDYDAAEIAQKLIEIADSMNDNIAFNEALVELKKAAAQGAIDAAFNQTVKTVCQTGLPPCPELSPEMQLLKTSAAFCRLVGKSCPDLRNDIVITTIAFITTNLQGWITEQGGWGGLDI